MNSTKYFLPLRDRSGCKTWMPDSAALTAQMPDFSISIEKSRHLSSLRWKGNTSLDKRVARETRLSFARRPYWPRTNGMFPGTGPALVLLAFFIFHLLSPTRAYACSLCKEAISKMENIWFAIGLNWSIYLMISVPFILVGSFGTVLYLNYRKHQSRES